VTQRVGWMSKSSTNDDSQIIKRIAKGDRQALSELYARYQRVLFNYLLQLTPDRGLAEEILQDTLVAVWQCARNFESRSSVQTWLIGIARRQAHNELRRHKLPLADEVALEELVAIGPEPEDLVLADIARDELVAAFHLLAPVHREILVLSFIHEFSYREIAKILSVPPGTVKSRLSNARRALRNLLDASKEMK
jgi:RNA polymerase sigma factor, sigma-70 family